MGWDFIAKTGRGAASRLGGDWHRVPAVAIGKTGMTVNELFCTAFGLSDGDTVQIATSTHKRAIGFRIISTPDERHFGYAVQDQHKSKSKRITIPKIARMFPDCVDRAYRAHLNPEQRIVEVDLSPSNVIQ